MAAQKKLQKGSEYAHLDLDGDGVVSDEELEMDRKMLELQDLKSDMENEDKKQDAQRNMAWFALTGMLLYPFAVVLSVWMNLDQAGDALIDVTIKTANGRLTCAEALGHREFIITKLYRSA